MTDPFDPLRALTVLNQQGVRYVVIGGVAASLLGSSLLTFDLDICYARDETNLRALAAALREIHARLRGAPEDLPFQLDEMTLKNGDHFTFSTDVGDLDVLGTPKGTDGYEQLVRDADRLELDGVSVRVASLESLVRMKEAAGRAKDKWALEILAAVRDELERKADA